MDLVGVEVLAGDLAEVGEEVSGEDGGEVIPIRFAWHIPGCQEVGDGEQLDIMELLLIITGVPIIHIIHILDMDMVRLLIRANQ